MGGAASANSANVQPPSVTNQNLPSTPVHHGQANRSNNSKKPPTNDVKATNDTKESKSPGQSYRQFEGTYDSAANDKRYKAPATNGRNRSSVLATDTDSITVDQQSTSSKKDVSSKSKQKQELYFPTVDDIVFETFYHKDGRECECMYMNGQRFYLDSWNSKEWQVFPMKWYDHGILITNTIIKEQETVKGDNQSQTTKGRGKEKKDENNRAVSERRRDDREGWIEHPKRGKVPTYIFEERHNVHCFFDVYSGMWLRLPLSWELLNTDVKKTVEKIESSVPSWNDRFEILAMLRACNYRMEECVSNYLQIEGDDLKGARNAGDAKTMQVKDQEISELRKKLQEMEKKLHEETKSKNESKGLAKELQSRISGAEAEMNTARAKLDSLQQSRPKTAQTKVLPVARINEEDLEMLMKKSKQLNKTYIELKMDASRWVADVAKSISQARNMASKLKTADVDQMKQLEEVRDLYRREANQRRMLYNQLQELRGNIRVFLRCRKDSSVACCMKFPTDQDIDIASTTGGRKKFQFDKVFEPGATQEKVFEDTLPIIACCVDGYNVCIMAYGQTGSGKTYTMMGPHNNPGVNIRSLKELLKICKERSETVTYSIKISIIEIYNETLQDLLTKDAKHLELRAQGNTISIPNITEREVHTLADIQKVMEMGDENRSVASTKMNSSSSRSHLVVVVNVTGTDKVTGGQSIGKLMLCDLAGSERINKSEAAGQRLVEAAAINKSLSALGQVFSSLRSKQLHIPYRNSKLTHILQPALGGEAKACLFVNVSPDANNLPETLSTLQFGANARQIQLGMAKQNIVQKPDS